MSQRIEFDFLQATSQKLSADGADADTINQRYGKLRNYLERIRNFESDGKRKLWLKMHDKTQRFNENKIVKIFEGKSLEHRERKKLCVYVQNFMRDLPCFTNRQWDTITVNVIQVGDVDEVTSKCDYKESDFTYLKYQESDLFILCVGVALYLIMEKSQDNQARISQQKKFDFSYEASLRLSVDGPDEATMKKRCSMLENYMQLMKNFWDTREPNWWHNVHDMGFFNENTIVQLFEGKCLTQKSKRDLSTYLQKFMRELPCFEDRRWKTETVTVNQVIYGEAFAGVITYLKYQQSDFTFLCLGVALFLIMEKPVYRA